MKRKKNLSTDNAQIKYQQGFGTKLPKIKAQKTNHLQEMSYQESDNVDKAEELDKAGCTYLKVHNYEKAKESFKKAIELNPSKIEYYDNLIKIYLVCKNYENACTAIQKIFDLKGRTVTSWLKLADIIIEHADVDNADCEQLLSYAMQSYENAGKKGYKKITKHYISVQHDFSESSKLARIKDATLPALTEHAYMSFLSGNYIKSLDSFSKVITTRTENMTEINLDIFVTVKTAIAKILKLNERKPDLVSAQLKKTDLTKDIDFVSQFSNDHTKYLQHKMKNYHARAKSILLDYTKNLTELLSEALHIKDLHKEILSFLVLKDDAGNTPKAVVVSDTAQGSNIVTEITDQEAQDIGIIGQVESLSDAT